MLGTCLSFLCICTSRPCLPRVGFFAVDVLVVVCGCGGRIIHSISHSRLHGGVGFCLAYSSIGIKG